MEFKSFDTHWSEQLSIANWDDGVKITVLDSDGYCQEADMTYETAKAIRDHLTHILEGREVK